MASKLGQAFTVRALFTHGARADLLRIGRYGALHSVLVNGYIDVIQEFSKKDSSSLQWRQPTNLLYVAASRGSWKAVTTLLALGMDPNDSLVLLESGADPNCLGPLGVDTPLWFATMRRPSLQCVRHLLDHGGDPNHKHRRPPLLSELVSSHKDVNIIIKLCNTLIASDLPIEINSSDSRGDTALIIACRRESLPLIQWLLKHGANINAVDDAGRSTLYFAVQSGKGTLVQELLKLEPNLEVLDKKANMTLLQAALQRPTIVQLLLDAGADPGFPNLDGNTLMNSAVLDSNPDVIKMLIEKKANIHRRDSSGRTPIYAAVSYAQNAFIVRLLADSGAHLDGIDPSGRSFLHITLNAPPPPEVLKILLEFRKFVDVNCRDQLGQTPLLAATTGGNIECLKLLIKAGVDMNAQDSLGKTALHNAAWFNNTELLNILLSQANVNLNIRSPLIGTPLDVACYNLRFDIFWPLLEHRADPRTIDPNMLRCTTLMSALLPRNIFKPPRRCPKG
ncbi:hypothetical protein AJ79_05221 [Helicocarpus griseus UAMH5409]|uniref:Uncharacterized protein n=1 Tax=Helicocarpus griseus UAMH5409 TaxID=1447875 RepID=A0A2B7XQ14_9EURO|nr:hypothetical protein AJ79_05221 [Helicocarpus griseus UAMH5409]